jgi:hypothetical protein
MRLAAAAVAVAAIGLPAAAAVARPRVVAFDCHIGDGRTRILVPREREESTDDEIQCRASLRGLGGRSAPDLVAELRVLPPGERFRVVASDKLSHAEGQRDAAQLEALLVPHATWVSAVDWRARGAPRVRLVLCIYDKPSRGGKRWRLIATRQLELGRGRG